MRKADEIDYRLIGDDLQAVIVTLDPGEAVTAEAGAMMYMEDGVRPITTLDPNNAAGGMLGKLMMGAKRVISGDSFLCGARGLDVSVALQRKIGAGFFGGEGLFYVRLRGPGRIVLQTLPFSRLADRIIAAAPAGRTGGGSSGTIGSLGRIFGDE